MSGLLAMAHHNEPVDEATNLGTGGKIRTRDLAKWINELSGNKTKKVFKERRNWDKKIRLLSSVEKAKTILKYEPWHRAQGWAEADPHLVQAKLGRHKA